MPASRHFSRSPVKALPVIATIRGRLSAAQRLQICRAASKPSISGIWTSRKRISYAVFCLKKKKKKHDPVASVEAEPAVTIGVDALELPQCPVVALLDQD